MVKILSQKNLVFYNFFKKHFFILPIYRDNGIFFLNNKNTALMLEKIFIVDGSSILYRSFYALKPLYSNSGVPTNAIVGFLKSLKKLVEKHKAQNVVIAWDTATSSFLRREIYSDYKINRLTIPDELKQQKEFLTKILDALKIFQISKDGLEADDIIASLAEKLKNENQVVIVSTDKDLQQLIEKNVTMLDLFKNVETDEKAVSEKYEFGPEKINFFYSLVGDSSDNIPGVKGIGPKSATNIVLQFNDLENLYENLHQVKSDKVKNLLLQNKENAFLSRQLFTPIYKDIEFDFSKIKFNQKNWDFAQAQEFFKELTLNSFLKDQENQQPQGTSLKESGFEFEQITDVEILKNKLKKIIEKNMPLAIDLETSGLSWHLNKIVGVSLCWQTKFGIYIPLEHKDFDSKKKIQNQIGLEDLQEILNPIFENEKITKIFHNAKFDCLFFKKHWNIDIKGQIFDTAIAARILNPEWQRVGLKTLSLSKFGIERTECKDLLKKYSSFDFVPLDQALDYAAADAAQTFELFLLFKKELANDPKSEKLFYDIEMPLSKILLQMEFAGISFDCDLIKKIKTEVDKTLSQLESKIFGFLDSLQISHLNLNSPKQVSELIFDQLKLKENTNPNKRSVDEKTLEELKNLSPIPGLILEHRKFRKLKTTYIESLPKFINPETKKIHTSYSQVVVATGRLSSSDPNLQNIPVTSNEKLNVRNCFVAQKNKIFISADYSQVELRVLAYLTQDKQLLASFNQNLDIHLKTASQVFQKDLSQVTNQERSMAKRVNFGILYGLSSFGLSKDLGVSRQDAKNFIDNFFKLYPAVKPWMEELIKNAKETGYVQTFLGRKRWFKGLNDKNKIIANASERGAINAAIQGSASDIIKQAMINITNATAKNKIDLNMLLQVHDELVFETTENNLQLKKEVIKKSMENVFDWNIPIPINLKTGKSWGELS